MALPFTELARNLFRLYNMDGTARQPGEGLARWGAEVEAMLTALGADALDIEFPYGFILAVHDVRINEKVADWLLEIDANIGRSASVLSTFDLAPHANQAISVIACAFSSNRVPAARVNEAVSARSIRAIANLTLHKTILASAIVRENERCRGCRDRNPAGCAAVVGAVEIDRVARADIETALETAVARALADGKSIVARAHDILVSEIAADDILACAEIVGSADALIVPPRPNLAVLHVAHEEAGVADRGGVGFGFEVEDADAGTPCDFADPDAYFGVLLEAQRLIERDDGSGYVHHSAHFIVDTRRAIGQPSDQIVYFDIVALREVERAA